MELSAQFIFNNVDHILRNICLVALSVSFLISPTLVVCLGRLPDAFFFVLRFVSCLWILPAFVRHTKICWQTTLSGLWLLLFLVLFVLLLLLLLVLLLLLLLFPLIIVTITDFRSTYFPWGLFPVGPTSHDILTNWNRLITNHSLGR